MNKRAWYKDWRYWCSVIFIWIGVSLFLPFNPFGLIKYWVTLGFITVGIILLDIDRK